MSAKLFVLATPIGNRKDITLRALEILRSVPVIVAEDTRRTSLLLKHFEIPKKRFFSCHKFNERSQADKIMQILSEGSDIALVSDSGTPGISDPGQYIVKKAHEQGYCVTPVPGPSAITSALCVSGIAEKGFVFIGFLGKKKKDIDKALKIMSDTGLPVLFYESPKRICKTLAFLEESKPECFLVLCRELTKMHEEILKGRVKDIFELLKARPGVKGEIVVLMTEGI